MEALTVGPLVSQWGAVGALLAALLGVFLWAFKRLFDHSLAQQRVYTDVIVSHTKAMEDLTRTLAHHHETVREQLDDITGRINLLTGERMRRQDDTPPSGRRG